MMGGDRDQTADSHDDGDRGQTTLDFAIGVSVFILVVIFVFAFVPGTLQPFEESAQQETSAADRLASQLSTGMLANPQEPYVLDRACTVIFFESREDGFDPGGDDAENVDGDGDFAAPFGTGTFDGSCGFEDVSLKERLGIAGSALQIRVRLVRDMTTEEADNPDADGDDANFGEPGDDGNDDDDTVRNPLCIDDNSNDRIIEGNTPFSGGQCDLTGADDDILFSIGDEPTDSASVVTASRVVTVPGGFADGTSDATLIVEVW